MSYDGLIRTGRKRRLFTSGSTAEPVEMGRDAIERMVPHRPPFLFVERISAVDLQQRTVTAHRRVEPDDPVLAGHFPGDPVYPGVLLLETMAQACICLQSVVASGRAVPADDATPPRLRLLRVERATFVTEARPGDELTVLAQILEDTGYTATLAGQVLRGDDEICAIAILEAVLLD